MRPLLTVAAVAAMAPAASAQAAPSLPGKYGCSVVVGQTTNPAGWLLRLKASGRYELQFLGPFGGSSSGTWKKKGKEVRFKGGPLGGDVATRKAHPVFMAKVQLAFRSFNGQKRISCLR